MRMLFLILSSLNALFFKCEKESVHAASKNNLNIDNAMIMIYGLNKYNFGYFPKKDSKNLDSAYILSCYPSFLSELSVIDKDSATYVFIWKKNKHIIQSNHNFSHFNSITLKNNKVVTAGMADCGNLIFAIDNYSFYQDTSFIRILNSESSRLHPWLYQKAKEMRFVKTNK